jgi:hypothetical protein
MHQTGYYVSTVIETFWIFSSRLDVLNQLTYYTDKKSSGGNRT